MPLNNNSTKFLKQKSKYMVLKKKTMSGNISKIRSSIKEVVIQLQELEVCQHMQMSTLQFSFFCISQGRQPPAQSRFKSYCKLIWRCKEKSAERTKLQAISHTKVTELKITYFCRRAFLIYIHLRPDPAWSRVYLPKWIALCHTRTRIQRTAMRSAHPIGCRAKRALRQMRVPDPCAYHMPHKWTHSRTPCAPS